MATGGFSKFLCILVFDSASRHPSICLAPFIFAGLLMGTIMGFGPRSASDANAACSLAHHPICAEKWCSQSAIQSTHQPHPSVHPPAVTSVAHAAFPPTHPSFWPHVVGRSWWRWGRCGSGHVQPIWIRVECPLTRWLRAVLFAHAHQGPFGFAPFLCRHLLKVVEVTIPWYQRSRHIQHCDGDANCF